MKKRSKRLSTKYNLTTRLTGKEKVETDLNKYVTDRAIDGIFKLIAAQEKEIRKNPKQRTAPSATEDYSVRVRERPAFRYPWVVIGVVLMMP